MSYYQFNRQEILQKAKKNYSKEKSAEYYYWTKKQLKKTKDRYKNMTEEEKQATKEYQINCYQILKAIKMNYCCKKQKWLIITRNKCENWNKKILQAI